MPAGRIAVVLLLAALLGGCVGLWSVRGADRPPPPEYVRAVALLQEGDTAAALDLLRAAARAHSRFGPAFLRLGSVLVAQASEAERDFADRLEAERALRRALDLMGREPEALLEYGVLLRKRGLRTDALRVFEKAIDAAEQRGMEFSAAEAASAHFNIGLIHELGWEDAQNSLYSYSSPPGSTQSGSFDTTPKRGKYSPDHACIPLTVRMAVGECAQYDGSVRGVGDRLRMMEAFRAAVSLDPGHVDAAIRLLRHIGEEDEWEEYNSRAHELTAAAPGDYRTYLFRGLGLHHVGRSDLADSVFAAAKALMPAG